MGKLYFRTLLKTSNLHKNDISEKMFIHCMNRFDGKVFCTKNLQ